jgi:ATPase subunit of ABC transporter with duplicated ATPase domains
VSATLLEVDALETGYSAPIIGPITFSVERGHVVGLVGPNGIGKSTLLKAIADNAQIFGGTVTRRDGLTIAWMEQQQARLPEMPFDGWEYLRYAQATRHAPPERLASWLDQRVDSLSGGQFQFLSCWAALGGSAELVLLDEPTNNLDDASADALRTILGHDGAGRSERAVLIVSHHRAFLEGICDRVLDICG